MSTIASEGINIRHESPRHEETEVFPVIFRRDRADESSGVERSARKSEMMLMPKVIPHRFDVELEVSNSQQHSIFIKPV